MLNFTYSPLVSYIFIHVFAISNILFGDRVVGIFKTFIIKGRNIFSNDQQPQHGSNIKKKGSHNVEWENKGISCGIPKAKEGEEHFVDRGKNSFSKA